MNLGLRLVAAFAAARFHIISSPLRKVMLVGIAVVIATIGLATLVACIALLTASSGLSDRLAAVGDVIGAATLLLAMVAAVVALLAYAASTGSPDLRIQVDFPFSELNKPSFISTFKNNGIAVANEFKQLSCTVRVRNDSNYSAKNPTIVLRLHDMAFSQTPLIKEWVVVDFATTYGVTVVQWDGGANNSIHGGSVRTLPVLWLSGLHTSPNADPYMTIEILADGYLRRVKIPVEFKESLASAESTKYASSAHMWL